MKKIFCLSIFLLTISNTAVSQSIDDSFSQKKMLKDLAIFKSIRLKANSGLFKYRTKKEIDSSYNWAKKEIKKASTFREFYTIICQLTDFEGSLHNETYLPKKITENLKNEQNGYFPYPIKYVDGKWRNNYNEGKIPLGAEIVSINNNKINDVIKNLYKYYTTDGINISGKRIGLQYNFGKYYRLFYGLKERFSVEYRTTNTNKVEKISLKSTSYKNSYNNVENRFSTPFDDINYKKRKGNETYHYNTIDKQTGILTIHTFSLGNEKAPEHLRYVSFLDSVFTKIKQDTIKNLIIDVRHNGGGDDPNDLVTYSYLTNRKFSENQQAFISFDKIPHLKHIKNNVPPFLRFLGVGKYNKWFQKEFYVEKENGFYQGPLSSDHKIRSPNKNTFNGNIYLLVSPRIASAGSLFAAMVAGNENTTIIGEETMGGYYGHNGHTPLTYILPKSNLVTSFSIVNLEQDVPKKTSQKYNRGILPDYEVTQSFEDYLKHKDTQLGFVIELIKRDNYPNE